MANRKAGSGDGGTGGAKRSAAGKKGAGEGTGDAVQAASSEATTSASPGSARSGSAAGGDATAESQPSRPSKRAPAKSKVGGAGDGAGGGKGAAKGAGRGASKRAGGGSESGDLQSELRRFVSDNPDGWGHSQWEDLLAQLGQRGHDTSNSRQIGMQLERERLSSRLQGVEGVSAQKARSIVDRYGALYNLRGADVDEIAREAKVSRDVAERIKQQLG